MNKFFHLSKRQRLTMFVIVIVIVSGVSTLMFFFLQRGNRTPDIEVLSINEQKNVWGQNIETMGASQAYEKWKKENAGVKRANGHDGAHIFGELLFDTLGLSAFSVCDGAFDSGCYHGFLGKAVNKIGLSVLPNLQEGCVQKWGKYSGGCEHGIGHGVIGYLGLNHLLEALQACDMIPFHVPIGGCSGGVFMEYNFRTMGENRNRPVDERDVHAPCSDLPKQYWVSCYFEQTQWWVAVFPEDYIKVGNLCDSVKEKEAKTACFRGIGNIAAANSEFDSAITIKNCKALPSQDAEMACRREASGTFFDRPEHKAKAYKVCYNEQLKNSAQCEDVKL